MRAITPNVIKKIKGDNTQNQDQVMYPVSFSTINTMVSKPIKPIPPPLFVLLFDIFYPIVFQIN